MATNEGPRSSAQQSEAQKRDDAKLRPPEDSFLGNGGATPQSGHSNAQQHHEVTPFWTTSPDGYTGVEQPSMATMLHERIAEIQDGETRARAMRLANAGSFGPAVAGFQYNDMRTATPPLTEENDLPRAPIETATPERTLSKRLSAMFLFGQSSPRNVAMSEAQEPDMPASKRRKRSSLFWQSKRDSEATAPPSPRKHPKSPEDVPTAPSRRWRFDSLRQSVSDLSASLKQIAGKKRSREDDDQGHDDEQPAHKRLAGTTALANTPLPFPPLEVHLPPRLSVPSPPRERPFPLRHPRVTPSGDLIELWGTQYLVPEPVGGEEYEVPWTREERVAFGGFVRAAEEGRMDVDVDVE